MKILFVIFAYFVGSFPSGYVFFRLGEKKDIRSYGSQSTGATNVLRLKGWRYAVPVMVLDILKAALPVWLALRLYSDRRIALGVAFLVVLGHCFPIFIRFRGGKGVSTALGSYAILAPFPLVLSLVIFAGVVAVTRFVSLGSLLATLSFPVLVYFLNSDKELALLGLAIFAVIALRHASNIKRLRKGQERRFGQKVRS